ncbi:MAG: hypothetical protein IH898_10120 [Planctomycetes bacterium]|nr:hypothetical protein [Planctomycetota bacterium]
MILRLIAITGFLMLVAVVSGCKCPSGGCVPRTPCVPCVLEPAEVDGQPPDLAALTCADCELIPLPAPKETYQLLSADTCQCSAATNAPVANMVELERHWARVVIECDTNAVRENYCLDRDLMALHAAGIRNDSASAALKAFYQLAGLEAQKHFLQLATDETGRTLDRIVNLRERAITIPDGIDYGTVESRLHELKDQQLQLAFLRIQVNGQLQKLIGCPLDETTFYWPQFEWQVDLTPVDVEGALALGLATRADLRGLELMICKIDKVTLPVARAVLAYADGTLGSVEPRDGLIHVARCFHCNKSELPIRCRQLAMLYADKENLAIAEIKSAAYKIVLQQQRAANTQQTVEKLRGRVEELTKTRGVEDVAIFEISKARGDLYQVESKLIEQVVALEVAKVDLRKAQGMLALECGFDPKSCCEGCRARGRAGSLR